MSNSPELRISVGPLTVTLSDAPAGGLSVALAGPINEDVNLGSLVEQLRAHAPASVSLDTSGVTAINSCGIREWLLFMEILASELPYRFSRVGELFAEQAGLIFGILGGASTPIDEVDVPYLCKACRGRRVVPTALRELKRRDGSIVAPTAFCERCGGPAEVDADEGFLGFLNGRLP